MVALQGKFDAFLQGLIEEQRRKDHRKSNCSSRKTTIESILALQESESDLYSDEIIKGLILVCPYFLMFSSSLGFCLFPQELIVDP